MALTAKTLRPPVDVDAGLGAGLGVGGHGRAEALTVPAHVAPACVLHAQIVPECQIIIRLEHITNNNAVAIYRHLYSPSLRPPARQSHLLYPRYSPKALTISVVALLSGRA